ncbi:winged helix-turn-helix transcriptional regulator [Oryzomonas sagensis]|uniref:Winged helix-turn-helix transcriptional regulator n=1 Tax=Oryzomonas sagensis TaxID=2603857 RepID=A0ABQ6TLZ7_9BACT|nr:metalloregulator ArsR/SmtB family transcription factor [Oryzomonas sagensis]KAB0669078.1 winged helix-turn-helix transcriptional regulator [Oryzomonas sagensis]
MDSHKSIAHLLKILGNPIRLKILSSMANESKTVKNISEHLGLKQTTVSKHVALLKINGIIEGKRNSSIMHYAIVDLQAKKLINSLVCHAIQTNNVLSSTEAD